MILSETNWRYKRSVASTSIEPITKIKRATGAVYNSRTIKESSCFLNRTFLEYKIVVAVALLLVFQFSLYDFDVNEYTSANPHGVAYSVKSIQSK